MKKPTVYEVYEYQRGFPELEGKPVILYYLESERSLKWKNTGTYRPCYIEEVALPEAIKLMEQEGWYSIKFMEWENN